MYTFYSIYKEEKKETCLAIQTSFRSCPVFEYRFFSILETFASFPDKRAYKLRFGKDRSKLPSDFSMHTNICLHIALRDKRIHRKKKINK